MNRFITVDYNWLYVNITCVWMHYEGQVPKCKLIDYGTIFIEINVGIIPNTWWKANHYKE